MSYKSQKEAEQEVHSWGFKHVFTWTDGPCVMPCHFRFIWLITDRNAHYAPHSHSGLTTHLILNGELTITYPQDESPKKETFGPGVRLDVDAGRQHEVWIGPQGCTYIIGE